jgi:hypothetical protein
MEVLTGLCRFPSADISRTDAQWGGDADAVPRTSMQTRLFPILVIVLCKVEPNRQIYANYSLISSQSDMFGSSKPEKKATTTCQVRQRASLINQKLSTRQVRRTSRTPPGLARYDKCKLSVRLNAIIGNNRVHEKQ